MRDTPESRNSLGALAFAASMGLDFGREPGYSVDYRGRRQPKPADPAKAAKRKAQRRARQITRNRNR